MVGLKMNMSKTKVMSSGSSASISNITVGGEALEAVDNYNTYLGQCLSLPKPKRANLRRSPAGLRWDGRHSASSTLFSETKNYNRVLKPNCSTNVLNTYLL